MRISTDGELFLQAGIGSQLKIIGGNHRNIEPVWNGRYVDGLFVLGPDFHSINLVYDKVWKKIVVVKLDPKPAKCDSPSWLQKSLLGISWGEFGRMEPKTKKLADVLARMRHLLDAPVRSVPELQKFLKLVHTAQMTCLLSPWRGFKF